MGKKIFFLLVLSCVISILFNFNVVQAKNFDQKVRDIVLEHKSPLLTKSLNGITYLGDGLVDLAIASALPDKEAREAAYKSILVSGLATVVLKYVTGQERPYSSRGEINYKPFSTDYRYHSMPSGHTATAFALAAVISNHYPNYKNLSYILATLVGVSRIYKDVHWTSNVIAGAGLGYAGAKLVQLRW